MTDTRQRNKANRTTRKIKGTKFFVRIPDDMKAGLEQIAEREDRTLSSVARFALREYIEKHAAMAPEPVGVGAEAR